VLKKTDEVNPTTGKRVTYLLGFLLAELLGPEGYNNKILLFALKAVKS
jgi:hypothetical protein